MKHPAYTALLLAICLTPLVAGAQTWSIETIQPYGVYFVQLQSESGSDTRRAVLLK